MAQEILVAPIVVDKLKEINNASKECLAILKRNAELKDADPYEATSALEQEVKRASEGIDAAFYILERLANEQA